MWDWTDGTASFIGTDAFSRCGAAEIRIQASNNGTGTVVFGDVDGNGSWDFSIRVAGVTTLDAGDFYF